MQNKNEMRQRRPFERLPVGRRRMGTLAVLCVTAALVTFLVVALWSAGDDSKADVADLQPLRVVSAADGSPAAPVIEFRGRAVAGEDVPAQRAAMPELSDLVGVPNAVAYAAPAPGEYSALKPAPIAAVETPASHDTVHVALIFDEHRFSYGMQVLRSTRHYAKGPIEYHVVTPPRLYARVIAGAAGAKIHLYDFGLCMQQVDSVLAFSDPAIHRSAHCKMFLANIVPAEKVLYIDNDVTAVQDVGACFRRPLGDGQYIGMSVDMGEVCQHHPNVCWPMGFEWQVPQGLICGNAVERWSHMMRYTDKFCRSPGQMEPVQFNGGVVLLHLERMRAARFVEKYVATVVRTARLVDFRPARWGEQEFINSFLRVYPEALSVLPCGCNYQFSAVRREVKCPSQPVYLAHGWTSGIASNGNQYSRHFQYFLKDAPSPAKPPRVHLRSSTFRQLPFNTEAAPVHNADCPHQSYDCGAKRFWSGGVYVNDTVFVVTRTSGRPSFYRTARASVMEQSYPNVVHLVGTDDPSSTRYVVHDGVALGGAHVTADPHDRLDPPPLRNYSAVDLSVYASSYHGFNPHEVCSKCGGDRERGCANAPSMDRPAEREKFLRCFCDTNYPMNEYVNLLHDRIAPVTGELEVHGGGAIVYKRNVAPFATPPHVDAASPSGWIIYLDDDNVFLSRHAIMNAMARVTSRRSLVMWKSQLGRVTPSDRHFGRAIVRGDMDASGFMFHSAFANISAWSDKRCGDFRTAEALSQALPVKWLDLVTIGAQPLRPKLGGLGMRLDSSALLTLVIAHTPDGPGDTLRLREKWLTRTLRTYTTQAVFAALISEIIVAAPAGANMTFLDGTPGVRVVFHEPNAPHDPVPQTLVHPGADALKTDAVLLLADDVFLSHVALTSMLALWHRTGRERPVGVFATWVGQRSGQWSVGGGLDDVMRGQGNMFAFPSRRALLVQRRHLEAYSHDVRQPLKEYFGSDWQPKGSPADRARTAMAHAHFADLALALASVVATGAAPALVELPRGSIHSYRDVCAARLAESAWFAALANEERKLLSNALTGPLLNVEPQHLTWLWSSLFTHIGSKSAQEIANNVEKARAQLAKSQHLLHPSRLVTGACGAKGLVAKQHTGIAGLHTQSWLAAFSKSAWCEDLLGEI